MKAGHEMHANSLQHAKSLRDGERIPRRQQAASGVLVLVLLAGVTLGACSTETQTATTSSTTSIAVATTRPQVTTTTARATTTTTEDVGLSKDVQILVAVSSLESTQRDGIIEAIESSSTLERVDVFTVDVTDGTDTTQGSVTWRIEGSSGYRTEENQLLQVWELASSLALFWESDDGVLRNDEGTIKPALEIVVDGRRYVASYDSMVALADRRISQAEWLERSKA